MFKKDLHIISFMPVWESENLEFDLQNFLDVYLERMY